MFLKIEELNKVSTLEVVQLVRDSVHTICDVCVKQTRRLTRQPYLVAEVIPSLKLNN